jgi:hypothetical protein
VNSYKRFMPGTFAPTKIAWSVDNRTAGYRLCGEGTKAVRVECRIGGSDMNPYLAQAALLAAGIKGIEDKLELAPPTAGDIYENATAKHIPSTLRASTETLRNSRCCGRPWAMPWLTIMSAARRKNSTRPSPTGKLPAVSSAPDRPRQQIWMMAGAAQAWVRAGLRRPSNEQFETDIAG